MWNWVADAKVMKDGRPSPWSSAKRFTMKSRYSHVLRVEDPAVEVGGVALLHGEGGGQVGVKHGAGGGAGHRAHHPQHHQHVQPGHVPTQHRPHHCVYVANTSAVNNEMLSCMRHLMSMWFFSPPIVLSSTLHTPSSAASVLTLTAAELRSEAAPCHSCWTLEVPTLATQRARTPVQYQHLVYAKYLDSAALTGSKSSFCLQIAFKDKWSTVIIIAWQKPGFLLFEWWI